MTLMEVITPIWEPGDAVDGNGTLTGVGVVDDEVPGTFDYTDLGNTAATVTRTVVVVEDTSAPVLIGDTNVTHEAGSDYTDLGATWSRTAMVP